MRVIEPLVDAVSASNSMAPLDSTSNFSNFGTCAVVAMSYAPIWEASHKNWSVVKIGCPTRMVNASGKTIGWHMPDCQGTIPGTNYTLRCLFDPSEI